MKKLAITIAALSLSAGAAFAENPYVSRTDVIQSGPNAGKPIVDQATTASIGETVFGAPHVRTSEFEKAHFAKSGRFERPDWAGNN
ncbi:MAG: hypothetical protein QHC90_11890 [Shinella sp.]|nr:hypothetical protein [Shinella sp.]